MRQKVFSDEFSLNGKLIPQSQRPQKVNIWTVTIGGILVHFI